MSTSRRDASRGVAVALTAAILAAATTTEAATPEEKHVFNVKDFGAVGDGETNDGPAFQAAFDAAWPNGGTVFVPPGTYAIATNVRVNMYGGGSALTLCGCGSQSIIRLVGGPGLSTAFSIANADACVAVRDLVFYGSPEGADCWHVFHIGSCGYAVIERCAFYSIWGSGGGYGSIVLNVSQSMRISECQFIGCRGELGVVASPFNTGLSLIDVMFYDIGFLNGQSVGKTAGDGAWVYVGNATFSPPRSSAYRSYLHMQRVRFDEAPRVQVRVEPTTPGNRIESVEILDCGWLTNIGGCAGSFKAVERVRIVGGNVDGRSHADGDAFRFSDCGDIYVEGIYVPPDSATNRLVVDEDCGSVRAVDCRGFDYVVDETVPCDLRLGGVHIAPTHEIVALSEHRVRAGGAVHWRANAIGQAWGGAEPIAKPTVTGSWADGSAGASLAAALAALGLIHDETS